MSQRTRVRNTAGQWTEAEVPDQSGRTAVITGGNSGIGFEAARVLASRGARLILAAATRGGDVAVPGSVGRRAPTPGRPLDLGSLDSVRAAARRSRSVTARIDLLINNAGVMAPPYGARPPTASSCSSAPTTSGTSR